MKITQTIGYLRVSTDHQNVQNQKLAIFDYAQKNNLHLDKFIKENNQLIEFQAQQKNNFRNSLKKNFSQIIYKETKHPASWLSSEIVQYQLLEVNSVPNFENQIKAMIDCYYGDYNINWNQVANFINQLETRTQAAAVQIYHQQLNSSENGYLAIINALEHKYSEQMGDLQTMNDEKDLTIQAGLQEVDNLILENQQLKASLNALEEKLRPFATYLSQNNQTANLNSLLAIQDNAGWTIEQLREKVAELQRLTTAYQANTILLESEINQLANKVTLWEKKEVQWTEFYQKWEATKQKLLDRQTIERKRQKETIWENSQLITLISNLGFLLEDNHNDFQAFLTAKEQEIFSLQNLITELNQNLSISEENLKTVRNAHFYAKVKYMSLLAIDTSRNLLPTKVGSLITGVETLIFGSEVTGFTTGSKVGWTLIGLFTIGIWLLGLWKVLIFSWTKTWNFYYLFEGQAKDFQAGIKNDLNNARSASRNPVNYSKTDLNKAQNDSNLVEIENNNLNQSSNSQVSK